MKTKLIKTCSEERKMKQYICDNCEKVIREPKIILIEITGSNDSILMPGTNTKKDFCTPECCREWTRKNYIPFADGL